MPEDKTTGLYDMFRTAQERGWDVEDETGATPRSLRKERQYQ